MLLTDADFRLYIRTMRVMRKSSKTSISLTDLWLGMRSNLFLWSASTGYNSPRSLSAKKGMF